MRRSMSADRVGQVGRIAEAHAFERDVAAHRPHERTRMLRFGDGRRACRAARTRATQRRALPDSCRTATRAIRRPRRRDGVEQERHERARRERAVEHELAAFPQHRDDAAERDESDDAEEQRAELRAVHRGVDDVGELRAKATRLVGLAMEALHRANLRERFVGARHRLGDAVLHAGARASQPSTEAGTRRRRLPARRRASSS